MYWIIKFMPFYMSEPNIKTTHHMHYVIRFNISAKRLNVLSVDIELYYYNFNKTLVLITGLYITIKWSGGNNCTTIFQEESYKSCLEFWELCSVLIRQTALAKTYLNPNSSLLQSFVAVLHYAMLQLVFKTGSAVSGKGSLIPEDLWQ